MRASERPTDPGSNVRFLRPLAQHPRELESADTAQAAARFLRERGLERRFNPTSRITTSKEEQ